MTKTTSPNRYIVLAALFLFPVMQAAAQGFGGTVAASDGIVFAGETGNRVTPGMVFTYERDANGTWAESGTLMAGDGATEEDGFWPRSFG